MLGITYKGMALVWAYLVGEHKDINVKPIRILKHGRKTHRFPAPNNSAHIGALLSRLIVLHLRFNL